MASGNMKDIKLRIKSVESTKQITKAMELVASSKLRRAKEKALQVRPYYQILYETMVGIAGSSQGVDSLYVKNRKVKNSGFIVIAGDRGLAGGYNVNALKLALSEMKGKQSKVIAIGSKCGEFFEKRGDIILLDTYADFSETADVGDIRPITKQILNLYRKGEVDEFYLIYTEFKSALTQIPKVLKLVPLELEKREVKNGGEELTVYDPTPESVFDEIVPKYISGILYGCIKESFASEQGARRTAMDAANKNASEIIEELSLLYNRARQAAITQEISEIVAGSEALK